MHPELYKASMQGDVATLRHLLTVVDAAADGRDILDSVTPQRNTALHLAAWRGHTDFAWEVVEAKEDLIVARNADGDTPLHLAAREGHWKVAELLVSLCAVMTTTWATAETQHRSPVVMTNDAGDTPLHVAVEHGKSAVSLLLLDVDPKGVHGLNGRGESPLVMAARVGLVLVVRKIVDHPWVPQLFEQQVGATALHQALLGAGNLRVVETLLERRPELIEQTDTSGNTCLHCAAQKDLARAVDMLLNKQMGLAYKGNHEQQSPLHIAAQFGSLKAIKALLRHCPDVAETVDNEGRNAFHAAIASGKSNALRCLLQLVPGPMEVLNRADKDGNTPLHLAAETSHVFSALTLLRDRRVDPCVLNHDGHTARSLLEIKYASGSDNTMDLYEEYCLAQLKMVESMRCRNQRPAMPAVELRQHHGRRHQGGSRQESIKGIVGVQLIIASLVATVAFAAIITMPGGYNQTDGTAIHSHRAAFKIFVVSNAVAMCCSSVVLFLFLWTSNDATRYYRAELLLWTHRLMAIACEAMLVSFVTAVYTTIAPTARWPVYTVIAIATSAPAVIILVVGTDIIYVPL